MDILKTLIISFLIWHSCNSIGWQGYGNFTSSNLTNIWEYINFNIPNAVSDGNIDDFNTGLSTYLNDLWSPAWNVVTVSQISPADTIIYGYAFRKHWMWYNDYKISSKSMNFLIWKDYNCQNWKNIGESFPLPAFQAYNTKAISESVKIAFPNYIKIIDLWAQTKWFMNILALNSEFGGDDKAFSLVMASSPDALMYGRVCMISDNWAKSSTLNSNSSKNGKFLLFQTRSHLINPNLFSNSQIQSLANAELLKHNELRKLHGSPQLVLNNTLSQTAQKYSQYLAKQIHILIHSFPAILRSYGENLFTIQASPTLTYPQGAASAYWYSEVSKYTFGSFPPPLGTGEFTAMVWKQVTSVGFGYYKVASNDGQAVYVVANYYPTPNTFSNSSYEANILPPQAG